MNKEVERLKFFFLAAFIPGCFFICGCENSMEEIKELTSKRVGVEVAKEVNIIYSLSGKTKSQLKAPLMLRYQDTLPYIEFPENIHADFFDSTLRVESTLDARYGRYMETENKIFLKDSVRVVNTAGDTLYCNELYWDRSRTGNEFYTDKPVRIRTKTHTIDGIGLDAPQDFKEWHIIRPRGIVKVPAADLPG